MDKRTLILIGLVLMMVSATQAETIISGSVSGVWSPSGNPYVLVDSAWVREGETLIIQPRVVITCQNNGTRLSAYGKLFAAGTQEDPINITNQTGPHVYLTLAGSGAEVDTIQHVNLGGKIYLAGSGHYLSDLHIAYTNAGITGPAEDITLLKSNIISSAFTGYPMYSASATGISNISGLIDSCMISVSASNSCYENYSMANATAISGCNGVFVHNCITVYANCNPEAPMHWAEAIGFSVCSGLIRFNLIKPSFSSWEQYAYCFSECNANVSNNTIIMGSPGVGINNDSITENNVIWNGLDDGFGIWEGTSVKYNTIMGFATPLESMPSDTVGNRIENPLFSLETGELFPNSPCINRGDPSPEFNDPDGTRNDRGWQPFNPGNHANLVASQNSLEFGSVLVGTSIDTSVCFVNVGYTPAVIRSYACTDSAYSLLNTLPTDSIQPGDSISLTIRFSPYEVVEYPHAEMLIAGIQLPYYLDLNGTGVGDTSAVLRPESVVLSEFRLIGAHPNPFNATTVIRFELRVPSQVRLEVFDVFGRLVSGSGTTPTMNSIGTHQLTFDGSGLPSGIYLYRLTAGEYQGSGKMVLLK